MTNPEAQSRLENLTLQLIQEADLRNRVLGRVPTDWAYPTYQHLVLTLGTGQVERLDQRPGYPILAKQECYNNALYLMGERPELTYVEGWAQLKNVIWPVQHAWLVDPDGRLIDPTWQGRLGEAGEHAAYLGIRFHYDFVMKRALQLGYAGVLVNDWKMDMAAIKHGYVIENGVVVDDVIETRVRWSARDRQLRR